MIITDIFKFFYDENLKEEIPDVIPFGELMAGEEKELNIYIENTDLKAHVDNIRFEVVPIVKKGDKLIEVEKGDKVQIIDPPQFMLPGEVRRLTLRWEAKMDLRDSLQAKIKVSGKVIYKPSF